jgi:CRP/FNR family cyclic AMP-dependent transcriptional regulator
MLTQGYINLSIFSGLDRGELRLIDPLLELCALYKDVRIFDRGQLATFLFILLKGEVLVRFKPYDGPILTVARILPGACLAGRLQSVTVPTPQAIPRRQIVK